MLKCNEPTPASRGLLWVAGPSYIPQCPFRVETKNSEELTIGLAKKAGFDRIMGDGNIKSLFPAECNGDSIFPFLIYREGNGRRKVRPQLEPTIREMLQRQWNLRKEANLNSLPMVWIVTRRSYIWNISIAKQLESEGGAVHVCSRPGIKSQRLN